MNDLKNKKLAVFFDRFGTLRVFDQHGTLEREAAIYNLLADDFEKIYLFTYGGNEEKEYNKAFKKNIEIVTNSLKIPGLVYEFLMPFIHFRKIRNVQFLKSNQNIGSFAPTIGKLLNPASFLIIRSGYIGSANARLGKFPWYARLYYYLVEKISYRLADYAIIAGAENQKMLVSTHPRLKNRIQEIGNYVSTDIFSPTKTTPKYDIIYVARLEEGKNHLGLVEAARDLPYKVLFIGRGKNKKLIEARAKELNVSLTIIDKVPHEDLPKYYAASQICVFPSLHEGNPKSLLEAMSAGLPTIACDVPGCRDVIRDEKNGVISAPDSDELRKNIAALMKDQIKQERLGAEGRKFIEENYSLKSMHQKEVHAYERLISKAGRP